MNHMEFVGTVQPLLWLGVVIGLVGAFVFGLINLDINQNKDLTTKRYYAATALLCAFSGLFSVMVLRLFHTYAILPWLIIVLAYWLLLVIVWIAARLLREALGL